MNEYITNLKSLIKSIDEYKGLWSDDLSTEEGGVISYIPWTAPIAYEAMKFLYDNDLIIDFDWSEWDDGREFFKNKNPDKYNTINKEWVLKLLTAVARNDRFWEGAWAGLFENGDAQKLFARLLEIESASSS